MTRPMTRPRIGIVGCGKMARAMAARWLATATCGEAELTASTASPESAAAVRADLGIACGTDGPAVVAAADLVVLGLKPQQLAAALPALAVAARPGQVWLSMLAGVGTERLEAGLPAGVQVVRCMPNTPSRLGKGVVALVPGRSAGGEAVAAVQRLLAPLGRVVALDEAQMDAFTAVAGSGPAYVFLFLEALAAAARGVGLDPAIAADLALQVAAGSLALAEADGRDPAVLRAEVTSKAGVTAAALAQLAEAGWSEALQQAVQAARDRSAELART